MVGVRIVSVLFSTAAFALAAGAVQAQRQPPGSPAAKTSTLRCTKVREQYARVYNGGPAVVPAGAYIDVHAHGATQEAEGTGTGQTPSAIPVGGDWIHPIKFSKNFTECEAKVVGS